MQRRRVGILALQGAVEPHKAHLEALSCEPVEIRTRADLEKADFGGLILPGGESSTMLRLLNIFGMKEALVAYAKTHPVWGVCAGSILMAHHVENPEQESLDLIDLDVRRNAYGRQLDSFTTELAGMREAAFIRAPQFKRVGSDVRVVASHNGEPVWIDSGRHMATSFHPELAWEKPSPVHVAFVAKIKNAKS
ncbi:MAG: pyridoxal 5'-phosphate synthase glutaminase subunit PdxT [Bdellovibrionota bacterium]